MASLRPPLVMVVDDDPVLCEFICMALGEQGYRTVSAGDGMLALTMIERELPALILMDVGMPALGGREFATRVRQLWGDAVPCVVMSGSAPSAADRADPAFAHFLPKPFDLDDLFAVTELFAPQPSLQPEPGSLHRLP